ncbi:pheST operon leader peptide PheM [Cronobacter sakazakii]|nr:pheST operon leader peptide PheM [Cronobacter sakazakii]TYD51610.1 pheST operon leader peptide PheM [Cronobacter sakazakii]
MKKRKQLWRKPVERGSHAPSFNFCHINLLTFLLARLSIREFAIKPQGNASMNTAIFRFFFYFSA